MSTIMTARGVGMRFDDRWLYRDVDFEVDSDRILAVVGDNGVGKTTLVRALLRQLPLTAGTMAWATGSVLTTSYVPQLRASGQAYPLCIADYVALAFDTGWRPWLTRAQRSQLAAVLAATNLTHLAEQRMDRASGGEKQRAYLAQALVRRPQLLILDESTANLDNSAKYELLDLVRSLHQEQNLGVIMVSHDLDLVRAFADDYLWLRATGSLSGTVATLDWAALRGGTVAHA